MARGFKGFERPPIWAVIVMVLGLAVLVVPPAVEAQLQAAGVKATPDAASAVPSR